MAGKPVPGVGPAVARPDRYGRPPRRFGPAARRLAIAAGLAAAVAVAAVAWALSRPAVEAGVTAFRPISDTRVDVTFEVHKPARETAVCVVRARDSSGRQAGYAQVTIGPARSSKVTLTKALATTSLATTGEVGGCRLRSG
jgi:Domain of unknown function (DUF4307)